MVLLLKKGNLMPSPDSECMVREVGWVLPLSWRAAAEPGPCGEPDGDSRRLDGPTREAQGGGGTGSVEAAAVAHLTLSESAVSADAAAVTASAGRRRSGGPGGVDGGRHQ